MFDIAQLFDIALLFFAVLSLGSLSGFFSERVGIVNIGINGMMIFGALFYTIFGGLMNGSSLGNNLGGSAGNWTFFIAMILASVCTIVVGLLFGYSTIKLKADHIIAGTAINIFGAAIGMFLTNSLGRTITGNDQLTNPYKEFWKIGDGFFFGSSLLIFFLVLALIVALYVVIKFTKFGLRFISIGENPNAADSQGINVVKYQWIGIIIASMLAGLGGAIFMFTSTTFNGDVNGIGFLALAIMITGSWRIPLISIVSILFSLLVGFSKIGLQNVNSDALKIIPYAASLVALILFSKKIRGPKFAGQHFDKSRR